MLDQARDGLPHIALVYGQAAAAEHVRDAVAGQVEIVYAAAAGEFDVARMATVHATAALVNLDDGDWLGDVEARLLDAGVAVVYNDPEISRGLDGWERARWLRHLVAKLSGSREVDPPRPASAVPLVSADTDAATTPESESGAVIAPESPPEVVVPAAEAAELPLSSEEIESMTMTVALAAGQDPMNMPQPDVATIMAQSPADLMAMDLAVEEAAASATGTRPAASAGIGAAQDAGFDADAGLDVDTEALSAMIDARLAEPETTVPSDSSQVWRVVGDSEAPSGQPEGAGESAVAAAVVPPAIEPAVEDDADVLASLPSLDDWALVDAEAPLAKAAPAGSKSPEPILSDSFAGLELVPMETIVPVHTHTDPIERWLHESSSAKPHAEGGAAKASGGKS